MLVCSTAQRPEDSAQVHTDTPTHGHSPWHMLPVGRGGVVVALLHHVAQPVPNACNNGRKPTPEPSPSFQSHGPLAGGGTPPHRRPFSAPPMGNTLGSRTPSPCVPLPTAAPLATFMRLPQQSTSGSAPVHRRSHRQTTRPFVHPSNHRSATAGGDLPTSIGWPPSAVAWPPVAVVADTASLTLSCGEGKWTTFL